MHHDLLGHPQINEENLLFEHQYQDLPHCYICDARVLMYGVCCMCVCMCVHVCMYVCMCVCMCVCVYM